MNFIELHIGDWVKQTRKLSKVERAIYLDLVLAYYTEEGPFPTLDDVYRSAEANTAAERKATDYVLAKFFKHDTEKGYTHGRCDEEIHRYLAKRPAAEKKKQADRERQDRARERRRKLFEALSELGITAPWDATTTALEAALRKARAGQQDGATSRPTVASVTDAVTGPVTRDNTATSPQSPVPSPHFSTSDVCVTPAGVTDTHTPTAGMPAAQEAADAMAAAGLQDVNAADPQLHALLAHGMTVAELRDAAAAASKAGKPWPWALARARMRRADAAAAGQLPAAPTPQPLEARTPDRDPVLVKLEEDARKAAPLPEHVREFAQRLKTGEPTA